MPQKYTQDQYNEVATLRREGKLYTEIKTITGIESNGTLCRILEKFNLIESRQQKHNHQEIKDMRENGLNINEIMAVTGISSKGTVSYILNKFGLGGNIDELDHEPVIKLGREGKTYKEIMSATGISRKTIYRIFKDNNIKYESINTPKVDWTKIDIIDLIDKQQLDFTDVGNDLGISRSATRKRYIKVKWEGFDVIDLAKQHKLNFYKISEIVGLPLGTVETHFNNTKKALEKTKK
jgi:uncharacterized protein YerC